MVGWLGKELLVSMVGWLGKELLASIVGWLGEGNVGICLWLTG
jgi:hypothetical protein